MSQKLVEQIRKDFGYEAEVWIDGKKINERLGGTFQTADEALRNALKHDATKNRTIWIHNIIGYYSDNLIKIGEQDTETGETADLENEPRSATLRAQKTPLVPHATTPDANQDPEAD